MLLHAQLKILKLSVIVFILRFFFVSNCFRISLNGSESRNSVEGLTYKITGLKGGMPPPLLDPLLEKSRCEKNETNKNKYTQYRKRNFKCICLSLVEGGYLVQEVQCFLDVLMLCSHGPILLCKQPWDPNRIYLCISQGHLRLNTGNNFTGFCTEPTYYISTYFMHLSSYVIEI